MTPNEVTPRSIVVCTAGHINHGKTMLVRALTGIDTDRLPEEKRRGITVDLGFATFDVQSPMGVRLRVDMIDVPGHQQFIRNMLAGAGGIDMVMLVISAREGVMPQTEEHLAICELLGIPCGLVVITKADLVSEEELDLVCQQVRTSLHGSFLQDAPMVPVSVPSGFGIPSLLQELSRLATQIPVRSVCGVPRLPVDRSFVINGFGTVVTGTLQSGTVKAGQMLELQPGGMEVRVRGLQRQGHSHSEAFAGSRVALNLSGVKGGKLPRGTTLVPPNTLQAIQVIDVEISLLPNAPELRHRARVRLHSFTAESVATVSVYGYRPVPAGASQIVRLRLASPVLLVPGDRFVLRRLSPAQTIGGGQILDAYPIAQTARKKALAWLEQIKGGSPEQQVQLRVERRGSSGLILVQLAREMGLSEEVIRTLIQPMLASGKIRLLSQKLLVSQKSLQDAATVIVNKLDATHGTASPVAIGRSELLSQSYLRPEIFDLLLKELAQRRSLEVKGAPGFELISLPNVQVGAAGPKQEQMAAVSELYRRSGLNAPSLSEAIRELRINEKDARAYVTSLVRSKVLIKMAEPDLFMHREPVERLESTISELKNQTLDVSRFKQITGLSRKYVIPLLEYLDQQRITRRQGNTRIIC